MIGGGETITIFAAVAENRGMLHKGRENLTTSWRGKVCDPAAARQVRGG